MRHARMEGFEARGYDEATVAQLPLLLGEAASSELALLPDGYTGFACRFVGDPVRTGEDTFTGTLLLEVTTAGGTLGEIEEARTLLRRVLRSERLYAEDEGRGFRTFRLGMPE